MGLAIFRVLNDDMIIAISSLQVSMLHDFNASSLQSNNFTEIVMQTSQCAAFLFSHSTLLANFILSHVAKIDD